MKKTLYVLACALFVLTSSSCALFSSSTSTNTNTVAQVNRTATSNTNQTRTVQNTQTSQSNSNQAAQQSNQTTQTETFDIFQSNHDAAQQPVQNTTTVQEDANAPKLPPNAKIICFDESNSSFVKKNKYGKRIVNEYSKDGSLEFFVEFENDELPHVDDLDSCKQGDGMRITIKTEQDNKYYTFIHPFVAEDLNLYCDDEDCLADPHNYSHRFHSFGYDKTSGVLWYYISELESSKEGGVLNYYFIDTRSHALIAEIPLPKISEIIGKTNHEGIIKLFSEIKKSGSGLYIREFTGVCNLEPQYMTYQECLNKN